MWTKLEPEPSIVERKSFRPHLLPKRRAENETSAKSRHWAPFSGETPACHNSDRAWTTTIIDIVSKSSVALSPDKTHTHTGFGTPATLGSNGLIRAHSDLEKFLAAR